MTAEALRAFFNASYGVNRPFPPTFEVDHETYANVCQFIFQEKIKGVDWEKAEMYHDPYFAISLGKHGGIIFKNVELILKKG